MGKRKITEGRITVLLFLASEPAIFPESKDGNLRRWDFKGTSERRAVRSFYFRDFRLDFMGLSGFCGGNEDRVRRTVSYADTVLQAHVQTKASAAT